jgi:hypothetical protein
MVPRSDLAMQPEHCLCVDNYGNSPGMTLSAAQQPSDQKHDPNSLKLASMGIILLTRFHYRSKGSFA